MLLWEKSFLGSIQRVLHHGTLGIVDRFVDPSESEDPKPILLEEETSLALCHKKQQYPYPSKQTKGLWFESPKEVRHLDDSPTNQHLVYTVIHKSGHWRANHDGEHVDASSDE